MPRLSKIYTKTGDAGTTALGGGQRVPSVIGVAVAMGLCEKLTNELKRIQNELFDLGSDLCFLEEDKKKWPLPQIEHRHITALESLIDEMTGVVGPLENFILPGGTLGASQLHVARTVCRRAERIVSTLAREQGVGDNVISYLNRLSDALFVMSRYENHVSNVPEPLWRPGA